MTAAEQKTFSERYLLTAHQLVQNGIEKDHAAAINRVAAFLKDADNELTGSAPKNALAIVMQGVNGAKK